MRFTSAFTSSTFFCLTSLRGYREVRSTDTECSECKRHLNEVGRRITLNRVEKSVLSDKTKLKHIINTIVVDPSILNTEKRLTAFLESMIYKEYVTILPSPVVSFIQREQWDKLVSLLRGWEWNLHRSVSEEWFKSLKFKNSCHHLLKVCISSDKVKETFTPEEKEYYHKVLKIIEYNSSGIVELAKELVVLATVKRGGIVSYTRHLKRWLKTFRKVIVFEISERTRAVSEVKTQIKNIFRSAGWRERIFVTFFSIITAVALTEVLPPMINRVIETIRAELWEAVIICVVADGA